MTAPTEKIFENSVGAMVLYAKSTVDDSLVAVKGNPATGALQVDTEINATLDPTGLATQTTLAAILAKLIAAPATEATLASIEAISDLADLGGAQRLPGNGASQALTVPANALLMRVDAEGGAVRISHTGAASATTIPRVPEEAIDYIPLKSTDAPQFYGASSAIIANINYYGART